MKEIYVVISSMCNDVEYDRDDRRVEAVYSNYEAALEHIKAWQKREALYNQGINVEFEEHGWLNGLPIAGYSFGDRDLSECHMESYEIEDHYKG